MIFLEFMEVVIAVLILIFFITQILIPLAKGTPYFPAFRKRKKLEEDLAEAREEVDKAELEIAIKKDVEQAKKLREPPKEEVKPEQSKTDEKRRK